MPPKKEEPLKEILPKSGLVYSEKSTLIEIMCKPRIMPIKSHTLERLEELEKEFVAKNKPLPFHGNAPPGSSYGSGRPLVEADPNSGFAPMPSSNETGSLARPQSSVGRPGRL
eukprot:GILI01022135.1.p1 GENE.GILI01022135.1~~GILI01022135.1.p1  ORF type:complete len:124 (+),score=18.64 GILI01022135.1:36-374(+)